MRKKNGFAIAGILYPMLVLFLSFILLIISELMSENFRLRKAKNALLAKIDNAEDNYIFNEAVKNASLDDFLNFNTGTDSGTYIVSSTKNNVSPIYYYRGYVSNNHVIFAGFCWQMVRTTENRGVKLVYDGVPNASGGCNASGSDAFLGSSSFQLSNSTGKVDTYVYNTSDSSTIKEIIDAWYEDNLSYHTNYLEDAIWCMDRFVTGTSGSTSTYEANTRLVSSKTPDISCSQEIDQMSVANGKLTYPIALLTADEVALAGGVYNQNTNNYLTNSTAYWLLSPSTYNGTTQLFTMANKISTSASTSDTIGIRPSIVLKYGVTYSSGDGTSLKPYIIRLEEEDLKVTAKRIIHAAQTRQAEVAASNGGNLTKQTFNLSDSTLNYVGDQMSGKVIASFSGNVTLEMNNEEYCVTKGLNDAEVLLSELTEGTTCDGSTLEVGPTFEAPSATDTHLGIVYLDPTNLENYCTKAMSTANKQGKDSKNATTLTGTKTGCMTWYLFDVDSNNVGKLLLNHNTTAMSVYDFQNINSYENGKDDDTYEAWWELQELVNTSKWVVTPRFITPNEIAKISGNTTFDEATSTSSSWFYSGSNNQTDTSQRGNYAWLYDYMYDSVKYNAKINENNIFTYYSNSTGTTAADKLYGYWTSGRPSDSTSLVWLFGDYGRLYAIRANAIYYGIRPVIEVASYYYND